MASEAFTFGTFRLIPAERALLDGGTPLRVGSRSLDILLALVEQAGKTVSKEALMARAWPDTTVDEASLRVQIAALRRALGDGQPGKRFIENEPGRGYVFVAPARRETAGDPVERTIAPAETPATTRGNAFPAALTRVIGRDQTIATLTSQLPRRRLVTIVGPGGVGKTTVAAAIAERVRPSFPDGVWFVPLASLPGPELGPSILGSVLGITLPAGHQLASLIAWLRDKAALIVLDNCEHVVGEAAELAEEIVKAAPRTCVLATSREPLRADGEWRHRLTPLEFPSNAAALTVTDALEYPAVQLFVERASASSDVAIGDDDVAAVVAICGKLDGMPLALELAAAQVGAFGLRSLATRLDDRLALLIQGRRTALPRQQTLRATLSWSYDLLSEPEQVVLRRLAVFQGAFTMEAAAAVTADLAHAANQLVNHIANLVDKSLIAADIGGDPTHYHLLVQTRGYALEQLAEHGERDSAARAHAAYLRASFAHLDAEAASRSDADWHERYGRQIGDLRAALRWAFSESGEPALGVALAAAATNFWIASSLFGECRDWAVEALARIDPTAATRDEMILRCGLGQSLIRVQGTRSEARAALTRALTLADLSGDVDYHLRAIYGLWLFALRVADLPECRVLARGCAAVGRTSADPVATAMADWMGGQTEYHLGEHAAAAVSLGRARAAYPITRRRGDAMRFGIDVPTSISCYEAMAFWSLGLPDRARHTAQTAVEQARAVNHPVSLCLALANPGSVMQMKLGDLAAAERSIEELLEHSEKHALSPYNAFAWCSKGALAAAKGDLEEAERLLRFGLNRSRAIGYHLYEAAFLGELAAVLGRTDRVVEGLTEVDTALRFAEQSESLWCLPELLRIKGELLAAPDGVDGDAAEACLSRSVALARSQQALSWELRGAMSLARLWNARHRVREAHALLNAVYSRFAEGLETADLRAAQRMLGRSAAG